ncbi:hypothetical protein pVa21_109 [Vibrio phage pVa-21]|nr:hypothetical protein pVa21_109 [Vibrio phage pVa-21]
MDEKKIKAFHALERLEHEGFCLEIYQDVEAAFPGTFDNIDKRKLTVRPSNTLRNVAMESVDWASLATTGLKVAAAGGIIGIILALISKAFGGGAGGGGGGGGSSTPVEEVKAVTQHAKDAPRAAKQSFDKRTKSKKILTSPRAETVVNLSKKKNIENIPAVVELVKATEVPVEAKPATPKVENTIAEEKLEDAREQYLDRLKQLRIVSPVVAAGVCSSKGVSGRLIAISMTKQQGRISQWSIMASRLIKEIDYLLALVTKASDDAPFLTESIKTSDSRIRTVYEELSKSSGWKTGELRDTINNYSTKWYRMLPGEGFEEPIPMLSVHNPADARFEARSRDLAELEQQANSLADKVAEMSNLDLNGGFAEDRKRELDTVAKSINLALAPISFVIKAHKAERAEYNRLAAKFDSLL